MSLDQSANLTLGAVTATTSTTVTYTNQGAVAFPTTGNPFNITIWNSSVAALPQLDPNVSIFRVTSATSTTFTGTWVSPSNESVSGSTLSLISGDVYNCILSLTAKMINDLNTLLFGGLVSANLSSSAAVAGSQLSSPLVLNQNVTLGGTTTASVLTASGLITANAGVDATTVDASGLITANGGIDIASGQPVTGIPYDQVSGVSGPIAASQTVLYALVIRKCNVPANFAGSLSSVLTAFTSAATYTIYHNGTSVGTLSFAASGTAGTFSTATAFILAVGDSLTVVAPSTADATAQNLAISIFCTLS